MKRSGPPPRRTELARGKPLARGDARLERKTPMRAVSAARKAENRERRRVVTELVDKRGEGCEARVEGVCEALAADAHEVLTRARGGSITDPANIRLVCRRCHDWIGAHPREALARGLLASGYGP